MNMDVRTFADKDTAESYARRSGIQKIMIVPVWTRYDGNMEYFENVSWNEEKGYTQIVRYAIRSV